METWKIIGIVVILVVVYIIGYFMVKESQGKLYRKARKLHREGEYCYESGDFDLADEYYGKANEVRKRAQELA